MASYQDLMDQAQRLIEEAEKVKQKEMQKAIAEIRELMKTYGLAVRDIAEPGEKIKGRSRKKAAPKYRGPKGELWSGRGRKPQWVLDAEKGGIPTETFKIK